MSDVEDDLEFYAAFEDELYKETSTVESDDEIDSELEATLYQNVHFASSFVITPSKHLQEESDISGDPNVLDLSTDEREPSNTNSGSVGEKKTQDVSKYPEVELVFSKEKDIPKSSQSKEDAAVLFNADQTTDDNGIDGEDGSKTNNNWKLIEADLMPAKSHGKGKKRKSNILCFNCHERGHRTFECTQPKKEKICFLCGVVGHLKQKCPNELCFNCYEPGHQFRKCRKPRCHHGDICRRCHAYGHFANLCPDKWRQFHFTTKPGKLVPLTGEHKLQDDKFSCYNCGAEGHLGHECIEDRPDGSFAGSYPFVVKYDKLTTADLLESRFTDMSEVVDGGERSFGQKRGKKRKRKNITKLEGEPVEDSNKNGGQKNRKRKRTNKAEMLQVDYNEDIGENSFPNTLDVATNTKKKRNNRKKNKIDNGANEPNMNSYPVLSFEEQAPAIETETKLNKSQKKRLNPPKTRKRTEAKKMRKPKQHYHGKTNPSRRVYFDFNGFV